MYKDVYLTAAQRIPSFEVIGQMSDYFTCRKIFYVSNWRIGGGIDQRKLKIIIIIIMIIIVIIFIIIIICIIICRVRECLRCLICRRHQDYFTLGT